MGLTNCSIAVNFSQHIYHAVHNNCEIIDPKDNWSQLGFLETFYIKNRKNFKPTTNEGLKASRELDFDLRSKLLSN